MTETDDKEALSAVLKKISVNKHIQVKPSWLSAFLKRTLESVELKYFTEGKKNEVAASIDFANAQFQILDEDLIQKRDEIQAEIDDNKSKMAELLNLKMDAVNCFEDI